LSHALEDLLVHSSNLVPTGKIEEAVGNVLRTAIFSTAWLASLSIRLHTEEDNIATTRLAIEDNKVDFTADSLVLAISAQKLGLALHNVLAEPTALQVVRQSFLVSPSTSLKVLHKEMLVAAV